MILHPLTILTSVTSLAVGFFVWRTTGRLWKAAAAVPLTWAILLVVPVVSGAIFAQLAGYPGLDWQSALDAGWLHALVLGLNLAVWVWLYIHGFARR